MTTISHTITDIRPNNKLPRTMKFAKGTPEQMQARIEAIISRYYSYDRVKPSQLVESNGFITYVMFEDGHLVSEYFINNED